MFANVVKLFEKSNVTGKFFKIFLAPDMDSAGVKAPYRSNFGSKFKNFVPHLISKGVPLLPEIRDFLGNHNFLCKKGIGMGFLSKNSPKN